MVEPDNPRRATPQKNETDIAATLDVLVDKATVAALLEDPSTFTAVTVRSSADCDCDDSE